MLFNSWEFLLFLPPVLVIYYALSHRWQNRFLLVASYVFYGYWDWRFLLLLWISTLIDFTVALKIQAATEDRKRKAFLWTSILCHLTILGFFKYFNFFTDNFVRVLALLGMPPVHYPALDVVLPVGISFYTFQTMSYTIDVYRRQQQPTKNIVDFALFVAFFPQLVIGPIERARNLLPQLQRPRVISGELLLRGLLFVALGYFKKLVVADNLGKYVDYGFSHISALSSWGCLQGLYYFAFQIYCDFSGYSDIATGVACWLGVRLMVNFRQPILAHSMRDFWSRWHISLTSWLRDNVFFALGGRLRRPLILARNLFLTTALGGLWHGAKWTYVLWGCYLGIMQGMESFLTLHFQDKTPNPPRDRKQVPVVILRILVTFHIALVLPLILFRSPNLQAAQLYAAQLFSFAPGSSLSLWGLALISGSLLIDLPQYLSNDQAAFLKAPRIVLALFLLALAAAIFLFGCQETIPFIYFQF
ncbi:MAG TPA: MBOAT family O-acyltransferase [bacterium]